MDLKKLKQLYQSKDITTCELYLPHKCWKYDGLSFAHRHKRIWYKSQPKRLHEFEQTLLLCPEAHNLIEYGDKKHTGRDLTKIVFDKLRGEEL